MHTTLTIPDNISLHIRNKEAHTIHDSRCHAFLITLRKQVTVNRKLRKYV